MLFLVIAYDGTDTGAPERRRGVRPQHLEGAAALREAGVLQYAGAMLDEAGGMIGSMLVIEAEDDAAVHEIVERDAYTQAGVWREVRVHPFRRAV